MTHYKYYANWNDLSSSWDKINYLWNEDMLYDVILFQDFCPNQYSVYGDKPVHQRKFAESDSTPDSLALLVQRYTIWNHPWCSDYTSFIADILKTKFLLPVADDYPPNVAEDFFSSTGGRTPSRVRKAGFFVEYSEGINNAFLRPNTYYSIKDSNEEITIPATDKPEEYIITFLYESSVDSPVLHINSKVCGEINNSLGLTKPTDKSRLVDVMNPTGAGGNSVFSKEKIVLGKHFIKFVTKTIPQKVKLQHLFYNRNYDVINRENIDFTAGEKQYYNIVEPISSMGSSEPLKNWYKNIAKFSLVVSGPTPSVVTTIENDLPPMSLWKNRDTLKDIVWPNDVSSFPYVIPNYPYDVRDSIWTKDLYKVPLADDVLRELELQYAWYLAIRVTSTNKTLYDPANVGKIEYSPWYELPFVGAPISGQYIPSPPPQPPNWVTGGGGSVNWTFGLAAPWQSVGSQGGSLPAYPSGGGQINWFQDNIHCLRRDFISPREDKIGVTIIPAKPFATRLVDTKIAITPGTQYGVYEDLPPYDNLGLFLAVPCTELPWKIGQQRTDDGIYMSDPRISPDRAPFGDDKEIWWWYQHDFKRDTTAMLLALKDGNTAEYNRLRDTTRMYIPVKPPVKVYRVDEFVYGGNGLWGPMEDRLDRKESDVFKTLHKMSTTLSPIVDIEYIEFPLNVGPLPPQHTVVGNYGSGFTTPAWKTYGGALANQILAIRGTNWYTAYFATNVRIIYLWNVGRSTITDIEDHPEFFVRDKLKPAAEFVNEQLQLSEIGQDFFDWLDNPANASLISPSRRLGRKGTELKLEEASAVLGTDWFNYLTMSDNNKPTITLPRLLINTIAEIGMRVDANGVYILD